MKFCSASIRRFALVVVLCAASLAAWSCADDDAATPNSPVPDASLGDARPPGAEAGVDASIADGPVDFDVSTDAPDDVQADASACGASPCATDLAVGYYFGCGITTGKTVRCWGSNDIGELAQRLADGGLAPSSAIGVEIAGLTDVVEISAGGYHACARDGAGTVRCWGNNQTHAVEGSDASVITTPTTIALPGPATQISAGFQAACARLANSEVYCWGFSIAGSLGVDASALSGFYALTPSPMIGAAGATAVNNYYNNTCVILDGGVYCVGVAAQGSLGFDGASNVGTVSEATPAALPSRAARLGRGDFTTFACAVLETGAVWCWGSNFNGSAVPSGGGASPVLPSPVVGIADASEVEGNFYHSCAVAGGDVYCWGSNGGGQLGEAPDASARHVPPRKIALPSKATRVGIGKEFGCALLDTGVIHCWGANHSLQLGRGDAGLDADLIDPVPARVEL